MGDQQTTRRTVLQAGVTGMVGALAGCSLLGSGGASENGGSWTNVDGDVGNSGANTATSGPTESPTRADLYEPSSTFSDFSTVPLVDGSTIAVWGSDGELHGVDPDGTQLWEFSIDTDLYFADPTPAIYDGTIYLPSSGGEIVAVSEGQRQWARTPSIHNLHSARADDRGVYLAGNSSVTTYEHDGTERWVKPELEGRLSSPAVGDSRLFYFSDPGSGLFATGSWRVVARNLSDGSVAWEHEELIRGVDPVVADGRLYGLQHTDEGHRAVALSTTDGSVEWQSDVLGYSVDAMPAVTDDRLYVATEGELHALDPTDGSALWEQPYTALDTITHSPRADGDTVFMMVGFETAVAIDAATGDERWSFDFDTGFSLGGVSNLAVTNGSLYTSQDGLVELQ